MINLLLNIFIFRQEFSLSFFEREKSMQTLFIY